MRAAVRSVLLFGQKVNQLEAMEEHPAGTRTGQGSARSLLAATIVLILYGSFLPFDFDYGCVGLPALATIGEGMFSTIEDLVVNVVLYVPLGALLVFSGLLGRRRGVRMVGVVALTVCLGSCSIESIQTALAARTGSWLDVVLNTLGATMGAVAASLLSTAHTGVARRVVASIAARPFRTVTYVCVPLALALSLMPFDFVTDTAGLEASLRRANLALTLRAGENPDWVSPWGGGRGLVSGAWFSLLAYFMAMDLLEAGRSRLAAFALTIKRGILLIVIIEVTQLFVHSHAFQLAVMPVRIMWTVVGSAIAVWLLHREATIPLRLDLRRAFPSSVLLVVAGLLACDVLSRAPGAGGLEATGVALGRLGWIPFESLWRMPAMSAVAAAVPDLLCYGAIALAIGIGLRRRSVRSAWAIASLVAVDIALIVEVLAATVYARSADFTGPALAVLSSFAAIQVYVGVRHMMNDTAPLVARSTLPPVHSA